MSNDLFRDLMQPGYIHLITKFPPYWPPSFFLVFWSPNVISDDVIAFRDHENRNDDANMGPLALIELEIFKCQISAMLAAILYMFIQC